MLVRLHPDAKLDYDDAFDWYAERSPAAALSFSNSVDTTLNLVAPSPDRFERVDGLHRRCLVDRFPYSIVCRHDRIDIEVVAIAHAAREPNYWSNR